MEELKNIELLDNDIERNSTSLIENQMTALMATEEGEKIRDDIKLLNDMGYEKKMINKVYILLHPPTLERAIDYMTEINGIYQHNFFESHNPLKDKNLCFICKQLKKCHLDYIPENLLNGNDNSYENSSIDLIDEDLYNVPVNDNEKKEKKYSLDLNNKECNVCFDEVEENEKMSNILPCGHICCTQCWRNYFKTAISEAKVEKIKCVDFLCKETISEDFILSHIKEDQTLVDKYKKFKLRAEIIKDDNKKPCPHPDCESYLEKSRNTKYVKCKLGHEYCFECLKPPHGKTSCEDNIDKQFLKWKKHRRIKRCPKCKIFIEKNEGCNHMTCKSCKYEWCWLCEGPYSYEHFSSGKCRGHQYTRADNIKVANICCFTVQSLFPCFYTKNIGVFPIENICLRYLAIIGLWIFGFFFFVGFSMFNFGEHHIEGFYRIEVSYSLGGFLIALSLWICFQPLFFCLITPFIIISLICHNFLDIIFDFLNIGK